MESILLEFQRLNGTTWFYLSFLLMIAVYFRFDRFFSLRNWDLISLFLLVPGLLATTQIDKGMLAAYTLIQKANGVESVQGNDLNRELLRVGYVWLFVLSGYLLMRCAIDLFLSRRPRIEPNLNNSGLTFLGISLLGFLMYEAAVKAPDPAGRHSAQVATTIWQKQTTQEVMAKTITQMIGNVANDLVPEDAGMQRSDVDIYVARSTVILCHLMVLAALILIGWQHFANPSAGVGMATFYLLIPLTALNVEKLDHILPAVFLAWAVYWFRRPIASGSLLGLGGMFYFPLFLVPVWTGFYWKRGARRFLISFVIVTACLWLVIWLVHPFRSFMEDWASSVAWKAWATSEDPGPYSFWTKSTLAYRLPILLTFALVTVGAAFLPKEKNLAELIALSVAVILGVQFWYTARGGTYVHWYLPLLLLMIFRPNLAETRPPPIEARSI